MRLSRAGFCCSLLLTAGLSAQVHAEGILTDLLGGDEPTEISNTEPVAPLTSTLQPTTPWPAVVSGTVSQEHNPLVYTGVDDAAKALLGKDYEVWKSHYADNSDSEVAPLPEGMVMVNGCTKPHCDMHKSLLIVQPARQKVYAAMVTQGKVGMWPSLMSWPDATIPSIKAWLADAADDKDSK